jgi:hypothetical protein
MKEEVAEVNLYSNVLMAMTSLHHIYGAFVYDTPWRLHILLISIPIIIFSVVITRLQTQSRLNTLCQWVFWLVILVFAVVLIGGYEGVYNHALKNVIYFLGTNEEIQRQLFPPPTYVMPNNLLFEATGIMQAVFLIPLSKAFIKLSRKMKISVADASRD